MSSGLSQVEIVNRALLRIGDRIITSIDENNERARIMKNLWAGTRDWLLRECPWNFATERTTLSASATTPEFGWANAYPVPADFLYMVSTEVGSDYRIEGGNILSDSSGSLGIIYIKRVTVTTDFDAGFAEALAARLAYEASSRLSMDSANENRLFKDSELAVTRAKKFDGMEDNPHPYSRDDWDISRGGGFSGFADECDC